MNNIQDNYHKVLERIEQAAIFSGRNPKDIQLVVVTKSQPLEVVQAVIDAGASNLGENYVEEAVSKMQHLVGNNAICWHMIGHVQSRKAESICLNFQYLHSLDSLKLAKRLSLYMTNLSKVLPVLFEFNVGEELSKSGWNIYDTNNLADIYPDFENIIALPGLELRGVMAIPPYFIDPEGSRKYFQRLRIIRDKLSATYQLPSFTELSMGMSHDYEVAIQEGATMVRIGQAILGPRPADI